MNNSTITPAAKAIAVMPKYTWVIKNETEESIALGQLLEMRDAVADIASAMPEYGTDLYFTALGVVSWYNRTVSAINNGNICNPTRTQYCKALKM